MKETTAHLNRRDFLRAGACSTALLLASPPWCGARGESEPGSQDEQILSQTAARIEKHRKGDGLVSVRAANGQPIPGAKVSIEQARHDFLFGCNLFAFGHCGDPEREEKYRSQFAALLNYATLGFYWASYEPVQGSPNYDYTDPVVEWARAHDITVKGHPLVWDHPAGSPRWLPDDPAAIEQLSGDRVRRIVSRFKDRINLWDVVNEATHLPDKVNQTKMAELGRRIGSVRYTSESLKIARRVNPDAQLLVNDYRTDHPYHDLLGKLREEGKSLFDVIGIQSHMHRALWPLSKVWGVCDTYADLGLPLHLTETTIVSGPRTGSAWGPTTPQGEADQADKTVNFYRALFAHPAVEAITWWDFSDLRAWQGAAAGFLRKDMSPKPVYERLTSLIKSQWWTRIQGQTGSDGDFAARAFYGNHRIKVEPPGSPAFTKEVRWQRGRPNKFEIRLPQP